MIIFSMSVSYQTDIHRKYMNYVVYVQSHIDDIKHIDAHFLEKRVKKYASTQPMIVPTFGRLNSDSPHCLHCRESRITRPVHSDTLNFPIGFILK